MINKQLKQYIKEYTTVGPLVGDLARKAMNIWKPGKTPLSEMDNRILFSNICETFRPVLYKLIKRGKP